MRRREEEGLVGRFEIVSKAGRRVEDGREGHEMAPKKTRKNQKPSGFSAGCVMYFMSC